MRRLSIPILVLSLIPLVAGCSGGGAGSLPDPNSNTSSGSTRAVTISIDWAARGRAAPSSALSAQATIAGGASDGSDVVFVCNRGSNPGVHSGTYNSNRAVRFGTYPLTLRFFSAPDAGGTEVASASSSLINDSSGVRGGAVTFNQKIVSVEVAPNQSFPLGTESPVGITCRDSAGNLVAVSEGSALLEVVEGGDKAQIVSGRLRASGNGTIRLRATVDGYASPSTLATVGSISYSVSVSGVRGSVPITINSTKQLATLGQPIAATGAGSVVVPATYGDRAFVAWRRGAADFSTNPSLAQLPADLVAGETLTAVYGPIGARSGNLSPNYNQDDPSYWPADRPIRVYFDPSISADQKSVFVEGFNRWSGALGTPLYTVVSSVGESNVTVNLGTLEGMPAQTVITSSRLTSPRPIQSAVLTFDPARIPSATLASERPAFVALASHEFGHVLGIRSSIDQGHSPDALDTMYAVVSEDTKFITQRDINTVQNIYFSTNGTFDGRKRPAPSRSTETLTETVPCHVQVRLK